MALTTREGKGLPLTNAEIDANWAFLKLLCEQLGVSLGVDAAFVFEAIRNNTPTLLTQLGGALPALSVKLSSGESLESAINRLGNISAPSASAPKLTGPPTITPGELGVGNTLHGNSGPVTEGATGSHTNLWQWLLLDNVGDLKPVDQATAINIKQIAPWRGLQLALKQTVIGSDGTPGNSMTSLLSGPITGTLPVNTVAPSFAESSPQASGVLLHVNPGTYSNGTSFTHDYMYYAAGVALLQERTPNAFFQTDKSMEGKTITFDERPFNQLGLSNAPTPGGNSVTISGTAYQASSACALAATVTEGATDPITPAVWPTTYLGQPFSVTVVKREILFDGDTIVGATLPASYLFYKPELPADLPAALLAANYQKTAGAVIKLRETVLGSNGQTYVSQSATKTIQPASSTLRLTLTAEGANGYAFTVGQQITPIVPATIYGGQGPYRVSASPLATLGLSLTNGNQLPIVGNPGSQYGTTVITLVVTDALNNTASLTFQVSAALAAAGLLNSGFAAGPDFALEAPSDDDSDEYAAKPYSGLIVPPYSNVPKVVRSGIVRLGPDVVDGQPAFRHEMRYGDPTRNGGQRSELSYDSIEIAHGIDYTGAFAMLPDADFVAANMGGSGDVQSFMQTHQQNSETTLTNGGPFGFQIRGIAGSECKVFSNGPDDDPVTRFVFPLVAGVWQRFVLFYRSGVTASQKPSLELWRGVGNGPLVKLVDQNPGVLFGDPAQSSTRDWAKIGGYKFTSSWGSLPKRGMYSSGLFWEPGKNFARAENRVAPFARNPN